MRIRWNNVVVLILGIFALFMLKMYSFELWMFLRSIEDMGSSHSTDEQTMGLVAFGIIIISLVGAIRIALHNNGTDD